MDWREIEKQANSHMEEAIRLNSELSDFRRKCAHEFTQAKYDPQTTKESYFTGEGKGVGSHWTPKVAFLDVEIPRWSRQCPKCGLTQYTHDQEPTGLKPKF